MSGGLIEGNRMSSEHAEDTATTTVPVTRTLELRLNNFSVVPSTLRAPGSKKARSTLQVNVKDVLHHYFIAKYGDDEPDPGVYEYEARLTPGPDWRFQKRGIGRDREGRRNASNELGKGFARWFCYEHLGFTYFCPLEDLIGRANSDGSMWKRIAAGDLPDYVCGPNENDVNILEAKGRYTSVNFSTKEFDTFRAQVMRAALHDPQGAPLSVKGYISAARWATEHKPSIQTRLNVEDPATPGEPAGDDGVPQPVGLAMVVGHYAPVFAALRLFPHAFALRTDTRVDERAGLPIGLWRCERGPLEGREFLGGILPERGDHHVWPYWLDIALRPMRGFPLFLGPPPRFFGLEQPVFERLLQVARYGVSSNTVIERVAVPDQPGAATILRDGTVLGPAHYFEPTDLIEV